jgi:hypothetical protein
LPVAGSATTSNSTLHQLIDRLVAHAGGDKSVERRLRLDSDRLRSQPAGAADVSHADALARTDELIE